MLKVQSGDLWSRHRLGFWVVVTTNIGWCQATMKNNMGAGVALQAALRWNELPEWYGWRCKLMGPETPVLVNEHRRLIFFPVKPLVARDPSMSWAQGASLETIDRSARQLAELRASCSMALPGCGNGEADPVDVLEILTRHLDPLLVRVVERDQARARTRCRAPDQSDQRS